MVGLLEGLGIELIIHITITMKNHVGVSHYTLIGTTAYLFEFVYEHPLE